MSNPRRLPQWCTVLLLLVLPPFAGLASAKQIVVYGASGVIGRVIVDEALRRGHSVVGVARDPSKLDLSNSHFRAVAGDVTDLTSLQTLTKGADAVIITVSGTAADNLPEHSTAALAAKTVVQAYSGQKGSPYVLQIGGATTMYGTREAMLAHLPFPAPAGSPMYAMLFGHLVALQTYQASPIRWTFLMPPEDIDGWNRNAAPVLKRTGRYRTSTTGLVRDANGKSVANIADLAVAAVDEVEQQQFAGKGFTIGY